MSPGQVLVVADDARLASFVLAGLRDEGFQVYLATGALAATALDQVVHFDMVLLDQRIAQGNVPALVRDWRAAGRTMPVLLLTEQGNAGEHLEAIAAGATAILPKPFPVENMFSMVRQLLKV